MNLLYAGIGALIVMMGLGLWGYHYKVEARDAIAAKIVAEQNFAKALEVNTDNEKTMTAQAAAQAKADRLTGELAAEVDAANQSTLDMATKLAELRAKDVEVDAFLKLAVPPALRGLHPGITSGPH
jgi:hypothetical protein